MKKCILLGLLLAWLCDLPPGRAAETVVYWTTNSADVAACQRQLNIIHGALQEYQKRNQDLPRWLSDLVPDYIPAKMLICPFVQDSGNLKKWRERYLLGSVFKDPLSCTYAYEFCTEMCYIPGFSTREFKQRQMELIGSAVPIVRCFAHRPVLNLGFDGSIYSAAEEWENSFATRATKRLFHDVSLFLGTNSQSNLARRFIEVRKPETDARLLDLSDYYNASLLHLSQIDQTGKVQIIFPAGVQNIRGIDFDARGLVHLRAKQFPIAFPERVEKIAVNRKCGAIHFLYGVTSIVDSNAAVGSFQVHLQNGDTTEVPIVYGKDVKSRWFDPNDKSELSDPQPAWISPADKIGPMGTSLRLYVSSWRNQDATSEIASVDFISHMTESAPFLLAITVE